MQYILPLYSTIEKFDFNLIDAARDLGASKVQSYIKIFIPNIKSGIITAGLFTLFPTLGAYAIPQLVGGKSSHMLGNIIAHRAYNNQKLAESCCNFYRTYCNYNGAYPYFFQNMIKNIRPNRGERI